MIFTVEGIMGSGKSTFISTLSESLVTRGYKIIVYEEFIPSSLNKYLHNPKRYTFQFQKEIVLNRIKIIREAIELSSSGNIVLIDRSTYGDIAFIRDHIRKGNLSKKQGEILIQEIPHTPGIIYYLDIDDEEVLRRISSRNRPGETRYTRKYISEFSKFYRSQLDKYVAKYFSGNIDDVNIEDLIIENLLTENVQ